MKCQTPAERAHSMLRAAGYATGGDVKQDKQIIRSAVRQHEVAQARGIRSHLVRVDARPDDPAPWIESPKDQLAATVHRP